MEYTFEDQLEEARRELKMRERNFPRWIAQGSLAEHTATKRLGVQRDIIETLERLVEGTSPQQALFPQTTEVCVKEES